MTATASPTDAPFAFDPPPRPDAKPASRPGLLRRPTRPDPAPAAPPVAEGHFAAEVLRILAFTGFGIVATAMGFAFMAPAGVVIALVVAIKGFERVFGTYEEFSLRTLSLLCFTAFAIVATAMAFTYLPPAGLVLALVFLWKGFGAARRTGRSAEQPAPRPTGNAAFDAYRSEALRRLHREQEDFEGFLDRLRRAKDKTEFDRFLEAREARGALD